jgi:hypothetical protein
MEWLWHVLNRIPLVGRFLSWGGKWLFLLRERRRRIVSAAALVARELEYNAAPVLAYETGARSIQSVGSELRLDAWTQYGNELFALTRGGEEGLWEDVAAAYEALTRTKDRGQSPPGASALRDVAERLRKTTY